MGDARHVDGGVTTAAEARLAESGLIAANGPGSLDVRTGVMAGPGSTAIITGTSTTGQMTVQIAAHIAVTSRGSANGTYLGPVLVGPTTVNIAAAPGTGSRIDVVYVKQQDSTSGVPSPDVTTAPLYGVVQGTAGSAPTKPSVAAIAGAEELATVQVFAGATSTNSANVTITTSARQTVARGAPIPVRSQTERDAITKWDGLAVVRLDVTPRVLELCDGTNWNRFYPGNNNAGTSGALAGVAPTGGQPLLVKTFVGTLTTNVNGDVTMNFPGGAFPNGVLSVQAMVALPAPAGAPIWWIGVGCTLSSVSLRAYTTGFAGAASLGIASTVLAVGW